MAPASLPSHIDKETVAQLLGGINQHVEALMSGDVKAREAAIALCRSLASALEYPSEAIVRHTWVEFLLTQSLSSARRMRLLASMGIVREVDVDSYVSNSYAKAMTVPIFRDSVNLMHDVCVPMNLKTADFFQKHGYSVPTDALDTPAQHLHDVKGKTHIIQLITEHAEPQALASMMATWMLDRPHWSGEDFYPVKDRLIEGAATDANSVFLVDVGGSKGHDLEKLLDRHPLDTFPGHLALQDLGEVILSISENALPPGVLALPHDFFTPQPIRGARAYFMHSIIHDYPDDKAKDILENVVTAMKKGCSKLLCWDFVLPDRGAPSTLMALDWEMMSFYAASERSESSWKRLLEDSELGLKVTGIWNYSQFDQSVIEAELA
ncbi:hypothetical protein H2200_003185 [Cladophialophora chaetospira]|uniref:O-methyltransferase C-terminal domain-containing protein n=1 Tax=Cladophialophora chaetospira TaxID=386627 RepID=A0AA38XGV5_9EURO|nr:hypothetical protein H2200_003185 [Cladophialophora chaetospira]